MVHPARRDRDMTRQLKVIRAATKTGADVIDRMTEEFYAART